MFYEIELVNGNLILLDDEGSSYECRPFANYREAKRIIARGRGPSSCGSASATVGWTNTSLNSPPRRRERNCKSNNAKSETKQ